MHLVYNYYRDKGTPFDGKKTLFVKTFFQKLEDQPASHAEILGRLAAAEALESAATEECPVQP